MNNRPDVIAEWMSGKRNWQRSKLRESYGSIGDEMRRQGYGVVELGEKTHEAINYFGKKLGIALYYKHIGRRLKGRLFSKSISLINSEKLLNSSLQFAPAIPTLQRASKDLSDQFIYRYNFSPEVGVFYGVVGFKEQLGYLLWAFEQDFYDKGVEESPDFERKLEDAFPERYVCV